ncbi:unnamed protein product [Rhizophagus irregularis]|nr:unnamed protein product [Rhizophagus irregularis]
MNSRKDSASNHPAPASKIIKQRPNTSQNVTATQYQVKDQPELLQQGVLVRETTQEEHSCHSRPVTTAALSSEKELLDQFRHCLTSLSKTSTLSLA